MINFFSVLVSYNPNVKSLRELILRLRKELNFIVLCNNSDYSISVDDLGFALDFPIKIFNFNENLGIAKAQSVGMAWAFNNGADFVLQMDQDSLPDEGMVAKLYASYLRLIDLNILVGLIGAMDYDNITNKVNETRLKRAVEIEGGANLFLVPHTLSSGSLINKEAYEKNGGMLDELFIDVVDHEYCWRLAKNNFSIVIDSNARLSHRRGVGDKTILGFLTVGVPSPVRHYYAYRNILYLANFEYVPLRWKVESIFKLTFKLFIYPFFLDQGFARFRYMLLGVNDAIKGKMGRIEADNH